MVLSYFGVDSKKIELKYGARKFEGLLGIVVGVEDEDRFSDLYVDKLKTNLESIGIKTPRVALCSAELKGYINDFPSLRSFLRSFIEDILPEIHSIGVFFTRYNSKALPSVSIHGKDNPTKIPPVEFIRKIASSYPAICSWYQCILEPKTKKSIIYCDSFETERTPAWDYLETELTSDQLKVIFKGDQCNSLVSTADLLVRYIDADYQIDRGDFNEKGLTACMSRWRSKVEINPLLGWTSALNHMSPYESGNVDLSDYIIHPLVYIPKESPAGLSADQERKLLEKLPIFPSLLNFLFYEEEQ